MLTFIEETHSATSLPQLDLFLSSRNTDNLFSLERRKERRKAFLVRAKVAVHGDVFRGRGKNISTSGLSLSIEDPPSISVMQTIELCLVSESFHFCLRGTVRGMREMDHQQTERVSPPIVNLAIEFIDLSVREKWILDSLIEGYQDRGVSFHLDASFPEYGPHLQWPSANSHFDLLHAEDNFNYSFSNDDVLTSLHTSQLPLPI